MLRPAVLASCLMALVSLGLPPAGRAQFQDVTDAAGLTSNEMTWGAAFGDLDGDDALDVYVGHHYSPPYIYWNDGLGHFSSVTHPQPWVGYTDRHGPLLLSFDNDADLDIYVAHGSDAGFGNEPSELYRNDGGGSLISLLNSGGLGDPQGRKRAASAADFDGDFRPDVYVAEAPNVASPNSLFRNNGSLNFTDVAAAKGLAESLGTVGGIWGDVDDDGDPDLLVGGEEFSRPTVYWRNDPAVFHNASAIFSPAIPTISGADWGDLDNDGDLDLAVTTGSVGLFDTFAEGDTLTYYFNTRFGDAGFDGLTVPSNADTAYAMFRIRAVADTSRIFLGPLGLHPSSSTAIALTDDYVGEPLYTPGVDQGTYVWRESSGGQWEIRCSTPDVNFDTFDGWLTEPVPISGVVPIDLEDPGFTPGGPRVWRNDGGGFTEITQALGLAVMVNPRDVSWVDYDNDGDLDLHVVDQGTSAFPNAPDRLLRNDGPGHPFADVTALEGVAGGTEGMGDGGIWGDVDGDLDLDLFLQEGAGPLTFSADGPSRLLLNQGSRGNALIVELTGKRSGFAAVGVKVTVVAGSFRVTRRVQANAWRGFQDPHEVHLGIGGASSADSLIVRWPMGTEVYADVPAGYWHLYEGGHITSAEVVPSPSLSEWRLAGVAPQPSRGTQTILLEIPAATSIDVVVQDVAGRLVRTLHRGALPAGRASISWDGLDRGGQRVAAGVYFVRATDGRRSLSVKAVRIR